MKEQEEMPQAIENPEWTEYRIQKEVQAAAELKEKIAEMDKQMAYSEKIQLRQIKLEAFRLASGMPDVHSTEDLITQSEAIYQSLIK